MTTSDTLMHDPVDHWLDLPVTTPRKPLRAEMYAAFDEALDCPTDPPYRRAAWTGVGTGYAVAFGLVTREALDRARRTPGALALHPDDLRVGPFSDEDEFWASGVLYGYKQGTSELPDANECGHCGQRLIERIDFPAYCQHGTFCEEHISEWHEPLPPVENCTLDES